MKTYLVILLFTTLGARGEMEFSGFFLTPEQALFSLTETQTHQTSGWLRIGQSFGGYTVRSFDPKRETIALQQGAKLVEIPLRASKVKDGRATVVGSLKFLNDQVNDVRASLFVGEESSFPLKDGVVFRIKPESRPDGRLVYRAKYVFTDKSGVEQTLAAPSVVAMPGKAFAIQMGDVGFSFTP